jgi:hypothetical protein
MKAILRSGLLALAIMACLFVPSLCQTALAGKAEDNLDVMIDAARKLVFALPENRAYLLVKQESFASPVGVIFGYVDNAAACEDIAEALSNPMRVGTFKCSPIF